MAHAGNYMLRLRSDMSLSLTIVGQKCCSLAQPQGGQAVLSARRGEDGKLGQTSQITAIGILVRLVRIAESPRRGFVPCHTCLFSLSFCKFATITEI